MGSRRRNASLHPVSTPSREGRLAYLGRAAHGRAICRPRVSAVSRVSRLSVARLGCQSHVSTVNRTSRLSISVIARPGCQSNVSALSIAHLRYQSLLGCQSHVFTVIHANRPSVNRTSRLPNERFGRQSHVSRFSHTYSLCRPKKRALRSERPRTAVADFKRGAPR